MGHHADVEELWQIFEVDGEASLSVDDLRRGLQKIHHRKPGRVVVSLAAGVRIC